MVTTGGISFFTNGFPEWDICLTLMASDLSPTIAVSNPCPLAELFDADGYSLDSTDPKHEIQSFINKY